MDLATKMNFPDIIVGSYQRQNMKGKILSERRYNPEGFEKIWKHLMRTDLGNTCSNLFKSDIFKDGIQWNENLKSSQEYDLMFQILKRSDKIVFDPQINTIIRVRDSGSISQQQIDKKWERYVQLRIDIVDYHKKSNPKNIGEALETIRQLSARSQSDLHEMQSGIASRIVDHHYLIVGVVVFFVFWALCAFAFGPQPPWIPIAVGVPVAIVLGFIVYLILHLPLK